MHYCLLFKCNDRLDAKNNCHRTTQIPIAELQSKTEWLPVVVTCCLVLTVFWKH